MNYHRNFSTEGKATVRYHDGTDKQCDYTTDKKGRIECIVIDGEMYKPNEFKELKIKLIRFNTTNVLEV